MNWMGQQSATDVVVPQDSGVTSANYQPVGAVTASCYSSAIYPREGRAGELH